MTMRLDPANRAIPATASDTSRASAIDAYVAAHGTNGPRRPLGAKDTYGGEKGIAAYAKAYGRSEAELRTVYAELHKLAKWRQRMPFLVSHWTNRPAPTNGELLAMCALPGTAREIWDAYCYAGEAARKAKQSGGLYAMDICSVLEGALGMPSTFDVQSFFDNQTFDPKGNLLPDRTDGKITLSLSVPLDTYEALASTLRDTKDVTLENEHSGQMFVDADIIVPPSIDRPALLAALQGARALTGSKEWRFLGAS